MVQHHSGGLHLEGMMIVSQLLAMPGIDANAVNNNGTTPLWRTASRGDELVVSQLLAVPDIDVNVADKNHLTPLWRAVLRGHKGVVGQLLSVPGVDVNIANRDGQTPLWRTAFGRHDTIVSQHSRILVLTQIFRFEMGNLAKIDLLQAEVDENDQSFFRLLVDGRTVKYITVEPSIYSAEDICFGPSLVSILPEIPPGAGTMV
ncbi:ankyrin repeat domain-containing protein [Aspergillus affinis]|uniref:ankyrin repeat domain-containing protein n=1 Tax=Aspergillus affinis TaxID=1070780 RepID=UPI0022FEE3D3|nr:uncharacterized protein KD926_004834 [Aspergillus affinis]KAI9035007.1 hypothetical protein KD926_004834 [Aspergillus affinis]